MPEQVIQISDMTWC